MKKTARFFSVVLCLILMFSLATTVSASMVSWGEGVNSKTLILTVAEEDPYVPPVYISATPNLMHQQGTATSYSITSYSETLTAVPSHGDTVYINYLKEAMRQENMLWTYTASGSNRLVCIPAEEETGAYTLFIRFAAKTAEWSIMNGLVAPASSNAVGDTYGVVNRAPTGSYTIIYKPTYT